MYDLHPRLLLPEIGRERETHGSFLSFIFSAPEAAGQWLNSAQWRKRSIFIPPSTGSAKQPAQTGSWKKRETESPPFVGKNFAPSSLSFSFFPVPTNAKTLLCEKQWRNRKMGSRTYKHTNIQTDRCSQQQKRREMLSSLLFFGVVAFSIDWLEWEYFAGVASTLIYVLRVALKLEPCNVHSDCLHNHRNNFINWEWGSMTFIESLERKLQVNLLEKAKKNYHSHPIQNHFQNWLKKVSRLSSKCNFVGPSSISAWFDRHCEKGWL